MTTIHRFEDLLAWEKSRTLTKAIYQSFSSCRDRGFTDQIQRAAVSIVSNIAEGFESGTREGFLNYLHIAKASAGEVRAQLYVASDIGYLNMETFKYLKGLAEECSKLIASFSLRLKEGGMAGLQRKTAADKGEVFLSKLIEESGFVRLKNGQMVKKETLNL